MDIEKLLFEQLLEMLKVLPTDNVWAVYGLVALIACGFLYLKFKKLGDCKNDNDDNKKSK